MGGPGGEGHEAAAPQIVAREVVAARGRVVIDLPHLAARVEAFAVGEHVSAVGKETAVNKWPLRELQRQSPRRVDRPEAVLSPPDARGVLDEWRMAYNHMRPHGGLKWLTPAALVTGLDDMASRVVFAAERGVSPVGATPFPPTHHADCSPTLSYALAQKPSGVIPTRDRRLIFSLSRSSGGFVPAPGGFVPGSA